MTIELAGITLEHLTNIEVQEQARIVQQPVPGMSGDLAQTLGRRSVRVRFRGIFYDESAAGDLEQLRSVYLDRQPIDFFTAITGEGYFTQVLITDLEFRQRAGYPNQYDYQCRVVEYVEPPEPVIADPFPALNDELLGEATALMDNAQNALEQVSQLTDLLSIPSFGDPTALLQEVPDEYVDTVSSAASALSALQELF